MTFVGVCGGRDFTDAELVARVMSANTTKGDAVVHGDARGLDRLADQWAVSNGLHVIRIPALWVAFRKAAGPRRNAVIAALPLRKLVVFPGGNGTRDMFGRAVEAGIHIVMATEYLR